MRIRGDERGAAVVEFALVLPILVMFIIGIVEFGRAYNARIELTSAVREGARTAALSVSGACPPPTTVPARTVQQCVTTAVQNGAPGLSASQIVVTLPTTCPGTNATVKATYPFSYSIPFVGSQSKTLTATGVMQCGG
ncbi:MAG: pilus assembly protein [Actinomycetota bacterium]|nr:pilus assembly protein [Actinomycetota bacterium]